jgi:peptidoglycan/xylan/chitin deacetylase (PgdA/CDA1 family)
MRGPHYTRHTRSGSAAEWLLWASGAPLVARKIVFRHARFALLLHGVSPLRIPGVARTEQGRLTPAALECLLTWLGCRFDFLTVDEYVAASKPGVLLTFDDGFASVLNNALPVLRSFGAPALVFVSTQHVADPRDWLHFVRSWADAAWSGPECVPEVVANEWYDGLSIEELRECCSDPLITIGSHGVSHAILTECTDRQLASELRNSKRFLEDVVGRQIDCLAYPRGDYDVRVLRQTEKAGYRTAFTIDPLGLGAPHLELPRVGIYQADRRYLSLKLSGLHRRPLPLRAC